MIHSSREANEAAYHTAISHSAELLWYQGKGPRPASLAVADALDAAIAITEGSTAAFAGRLRVEVLP